MFILETRPGIYTDGAPIFDSLNAAIQAVKEYAIEFNTGAFIGIYSPSRDGKKPVYAGKTYSI